MNFEHSFGNFHWVPLVGIAVIIGAFVIHFISHSRKPAAHKRASPFEETIFSPLSLEDVKKRTLNIFATLEENRPAAQNELALGFSSRLHPAYRDFLAASHELSLDEWEVRLGGKYVRASQLRPGYLCVGNDSMGYEILLAPNALEVASASAADKGDDPVERHSTLYHLLLSELEMSLPDTPEFQRSLNILYENLNARQTGASSPN